MNSVSRELSNISEAMAQLEAEASAIMEMVARRDELAGGPPSQLLGDITPPADTPQDLRRPPSDPLQVNGVAARGEPAAGSSQDPPAGSQPDAETPMDVDQPGRQLSAY